MMEENSTAINRTPPHSLEAEQSVIGSMMIDPEAIAAAASILTEEDFYHRPYALLYRAITDLDADGRAIDNVTSRASSSSTPTSSYSRTTATPSRWSTTGPA